MERTTVDAGRGLFEGKPPRYHGPMLFARQLGRYHLLDRIAFGGMAEIYRAKTYDAGGHERMVAIKRVLRSLSDDDDFLQMLVDEAKITSSLDHPNIAKVYEFVRVDDEYFIAMEYVDGRDLRTVLEHCRETQSFLPPEDCAYILMRTMEGLHAAHQKEDGAGVPLGIVHRDVSPSNIIVSYGGQVKLCDFGIAKARLSRIQTRAGVIKGKVKYMSPEQALGHPLDRRSDVFSGGSVLYEALTLECPFQAESEMQLVFRVREAKVPRPTRYNPDIPPALERILRQALARTLGSRYQSAAELAAELGAFIREFAPTYSPSQLGRRLREMFAADIERDLRLLEECVLGDIDPANLGDNLLAATLGEGAAYTRFSPVAPGGLQESKTRILPRIPAPETRLPQGVDLHQMKTMIFDPEERESRVLKRKQRRRPGASYHSDLQDETQRGTTVLPLAPDRPEEEEEEADAAALPNLPTRILRPPEE